MDTHTHFYDDWLLPDAEAAIQRALDAGVGKMIQADVDSTERPRMWEIGLRHPGVLFQMAGFYPGSVRADNWRDELDQVHGIFGRGTISGGGPGPSSVPQNTVEGTVGGPGPRGKMAPSPDYGWTKSTDALDQVQGIAAGDARSWPGMTGVTGIVAIGEIGLDYHEGREYEKEQKEVLMLQLELAAKLNLPVNIHLRDAWEDFLAILKDTKHLNLRGNLHCFSGSYEVYQEANRYGDWSVGIGGVVTFKNSKLAQTLERIPLHHILLETDAPYLAPVPHRGERNESSFLPLIAQKVAEVKGLTVEECERITTENAERLFYI
ncbi:MAG: TatD family hydrolase [Bacteroidales bacterium]|nr:TatD family hydrolase [Bacteroidales bacterium]